LGGITRDGLIIEGVIVVEVTFGEQPLVCNEVLIAVEVMAVTWDPRVSSAERRSKGSHGVRSVLLRSHGALVVILANMVIWAIVIKNSEGNLTAGTVGARRRFGG